MKKNNEFLYEVRVFDEGQTYLWFTDTLEKIIGRLNDGVEIGAEWVYPELDKCETAEELNDELNNKLNLSWFNIEVSKVKFLIVEEYRNSIYQNSYIMEEELEQVIKDMEDLKRVLPPKSKMAISYHIGTGTNRRIENLLTIV